MPLKLDFSTPCCAELTVGSLVLPAGQSCILTALRQTFAVFARMASRPINPSVTNPDPDLHGSKNYACNQNWNYCSGSRNGKICVESR